MPCRVENGCVNGQMGNQQIVMRQDERRNLLLMALANKTLDDAFAANLRHLLGVGSAPSRIATGSGDDDGVHQTCFRAMKIPNAAIKQATTPKI